MNNIETIREQLQTDHVFYAIIYISTQDVGYHPYTYSYTQVSVPSESAQPNIASP